MRILMISDVYFPRVNGVSTSIRTFRRELEALGHQVTLIAPDYGETTDDESWILRIPSRKVIIDPEDRMMKLGAATALKERLAGEHYDLLHIQTPFVAHYAGMRLARALKLPVVLSYHTYFEEYLDHYVSFIPDLLLRFLVRRFSKSQCEEVDSVVAPSTVFRRVLRRYGVANEVHVIPTGIDLNRFRDGDGSRFRREREIDPQRPLLLFVGRIVHEKNIGFLLQVVQEVRRHRPEVLFVMAGEGPARSDLRQQVERLGLQENTLFVGNIHHLQGLLDCYSAADAFIFASRTETQGLVLLEAMALGVPVVSTARMGTCDILGPQRGALVAEEEVSDFAAEVLHLLRSRPLAERLAEEGRTYVQEWSATAMARKMAALYRDTIETASDLGGEEERVGAAEEGW